MPELLLVDGYNVLNAWANTSTFNVGDFLSETS
jgi:predicted RNA-binding protein with PIN domain